MKFWPNLCALQQTHYYRSIECRPSARMCTKCGPQISLCRKQASKLSTFDSVCDLFAEPVIGNRIICSLSLCAAQLGTFWCIREVPNESTSSKWCAQSDDLILIYSLFVDTANRVGNSFSWSSQRPPKRHCSNVRNSTVIRVLAFPVDTSVHHPIRTFQPENVDQKCAYKNDLRRSAFIWNSNLFQFERVKRAASQNSEMARFSFLSKLWTLFRDSFDFAPERTVYNRPNGDRLVVNQHCPIFAPF